MKYLCSNCSYIYDEILWDEEEWVDIWTKFEDIQEFWTCPVCEWSVDDFVMIDEEILYVKDNEEMTDVEAMHIPKVEIKDDVAYVNVWYIEHPMVDEHYIYTVWLYDEYGDLIEEELLSIGHVAMCNFDVADLDSFEVRVTCNIHWIWSSWMIEK